MMRALSTVAAAVAFTLPCFAEEYTFDSDGTQIYYTNDGSGEPVILIHGYTATGALNWKLPGIARMLEEEYRVIIPDVRGHGESAIPADGKYGLEAVEDIRRLMHHLGLEQAHLVGYSMGGMLTIKFATLYPERVKSATIGGMGWVNPGSMGERGERYAKVSQPMIDTYAQFDQLETTAEDMETLTMPLRVIVGTEDHGQLRRVDLWKTIEPDLDVAYIDGAEHVNCVFNPDFKAAVKEFLDSNR